MKREKEACKICGKLRSKPNMASHYKKCGFERKKIKFNYLYCFDCEQILPKKKMRKHECLKKSQMKNETELKRILRRIENFYQKIK